MNAPVANAPAEVALSIEEAFDQLDDVQSYIARMQPRINEAIAERARLEGVIGQRMSETGARRVEHERYRARYELRKVGSAAIPYAAELKHALALCEIVPANEIEDAIATKLQPVTKADLRKVRKLADYGSIVSEVLKNYIVEARQVDVLVIEPVQKNVTGSAVDALPSEASA